MPPARTKPLKAELDAAGFQVPNYRGVPESGCLWGALRLAGAAGELGEAEQAARPV